MILGGKVVVENNAGWDGMGMPWKAMTPVRPEIMLIQHDERRENSAE